MKNNNHKNKLVLFVGTLSFILLILISPYFINAASSSGLIDGVYKYAKGNSTSNLKINFGLFRGSINVVIYDNMLTGFAWGDKIGWVNLAPENSGVFNDGEGNLYGYASSEHGGWINFKPEGGGVKINSQGEFTGYALSQKFGLISFNCSNDNSCSTEDYKVKTDWRPISVRNDGTPPISGNIKKVDPPVSVVVQDTTETTLQNDKKSTPKPLPIDNSQYDSTTDVVKNNEKTPEITGGITYIMPKDSIVDSPKNNTQINTIFSDNNYQKVEDKSLNKTVKSTTVQIKNEVIDVVNNGSAAGISTKTVATVGVVGGSTTLISSLFINALSASEVVLNLLRLWSLFLSAIGLKKKLKPWGTVYDSITKQPLDPVYVVLSDKSNREVSTAITDMDGRFGFLVPSGWYKISVKKNNYIFPSKKMEGQDKDTIYDSLYFGDEMYIEDGMPITINVPMDPERFDWNEFTKKDKNLLKFSSPNESIFVRISNVLFYLGFIFAVALLLINGFNYYNTAVIVFYVILMIFKKVNLKSKTHGTIKEKDTMFPISFSVIRIFKKNGKEELFHRVVDKFGNYYCLLPKGEYFVKIDKKNNDESYTNIYTSETFNVKNGILNKDFVV